MNLSPLLQGAYDLHVHAAPDVVPRAMDAIALAESARQAGMAGILLKSHIGSTAAMAWLLDAAAPGGTRLFSSITLNPPVGSLNPSAVETALRLNADVVFFPTYAARGHIDTFGPDSFPAAFARPRTEGFGITVLDDRERLIPEVVEIIDLIARYDAVLATGHLSPDESLALLQMANERGVRRMIVTHASEAAPGMSVSAQREAARLGALIEHAFMAVTDCCPGTIPWRSFCQQIHAVGVENVVLSSDFGQPANGPPVAAFGEYLERLAASGFAAEEIHTMTRDNPRRLIEGRSNAASDERRGQA